MEQSEENFERKSTFATVAPDFETVTATKFTTARGQAMVKGTDSVQTQRTGLETNLETGPLTEQASGLMFVGLAKAEGFVTGVTLRCDMNVAEYMTQVAARESIMEEAEMVVSSTY